MSLVLCCTKKKIFFFFLLFFQICEDWVKLCTALNIPLSKSDHPLVRKFLNEKVTNGGNIPKSHQLQEKYLGEVYRQEKERLKEKLSGEPVAVIFDETPDVEGRCVLNIDRTT